MEQLHPVKLVPLLQHLLLLQVLLVPINAATVAEYPDAMNIALHLQPTIDIDVSTTPGTDVLAPQTEKESSLERAALIACSEGGIWDMDGYGPFSRPSAEAEWGTTGK